MMEIPTAKWVPRRLPGASRGQQAHISSSLLSFSTSYSLFHLILLSPFIQVFSTHFANSRVSFLQLVTPKFLPGHIPKVQFITNLEPKTKYSDQVFSAKF
jgi:hypothetical protein